MRTRCVHACMCWCTDITMALCSRTKYVQERRTYKLPMQVYSSYCCAHIYLQSGGTLVASKSSDFGLSCLGSPSSPELPRMWNVTLPAQRRAKRRRGAVSAPSPGASGWPFRSSAWASRGRLLPRAQWARRRLAVSLPAKAGRAWAGRAGAGAPGGAARRAHTEGQGRAAWLVARHAPGRRGAGPGGTGFPRLLGAAARGLAAQGPLCGGPSSCADPSQRTIAQCCRPPGQALQAAPRPPKAREPGGAFL